MDKRWIIGIIVLLFGAGVAAALGAFDSPEAPPTKSATQVTKPAPEPAGAEKPAMDQAKADAEKAAKSAAAAAEQAAADAKATAEKAAAEAEAAARKLAAESKAAVEKAASEAEAAAAKLAADARAAADAAAELAAKQAKAAAEAASKAAASVEKAAGDTVKSVEQGAKSAGDAAKSAYDRAKDAAKQAIQPSGAAPDKGSNLLPSETDKLPSSSLASLANSKGNGNAQSTNSTSTKDETAPAMSPFQRGPQDGKDGPSRPETPVVSPPAIKQGSVNSAGGQPHAASAATQPSFDVAQIEKDGSAVIAGAAEPGARITLRSADNSVVGETTAGPDGSWVVLPEKPLADGETTLRIESTNEQGKTVSATQALIVSKQPGTAPLVIAQSDTVGTPSKVLQQPKADARTATTEASNGNQTNGAGPIRTQDGALAVGTVDYDKQGRLAVAGAAPPGAKVVVDVDGKSVGSAIANKSGQWSISTPPGTAAGGARISATASLADGAKIASVGKLAPATPRLLRVSLPFAPVGLIKEFPRGRLVVVQPGNSLWRIARRTYGAGIRYTVIYAANAGQIHNPDLIYPGQIFHTPKPQQG